MKVPFSYEHILCALLILTSNGYCDEGPALPTAQTTPIAPEMKVPDPDGHQAVTTAIPSIGIESAPGWWIGPKEPEKSFETDGGSGNGTLKIGNETIKIGNVTLSEWTFTPIIIIRYPFGGAPELLVGTLVPENGTFVFESENGTREEFFNVTFLNETGFPMFPVEEGISEEITSNSDNSTGMLEAEIFVVPDTNVTEEIEDKTGQDEVIVFPIENTPGITSLKEIKHPPASTTGNVITNPTV